MPSCESPANATGNRKTTPWSIGTKIAGQRRISDLRRSRHSSAAVRNGYVATITELTTSRDVSVVTNAEEEQKASQTTAPRHIEPHSTGRPWNTRAALHTLPTPMKH